ncbi:MGDG synthase family glycosyltransferase [Paenibacillus methanolicus]|uniref:Processive 1,2-diacylglycerol beta-glucosyltransferase n=1 Tax=Paenibacillus methanolicus TaxID=582686 RepID=A0A5S5BUL7_9BACL|nr:glycosyltransferase [Paenibacillus methanolicus]TYP70689.1 processive 1,2-diacylglycerol beta-glucosyltransferase [Paenibacillus methanolicus]
MSIEKSMPGRGPKVLLLYASFGDGHLQAARALQEAFESRGAGRMILVDLLAEAHPWMNAVTKQLYAKSFTLLPELYGFVYDATRPMRHDSLFAQWLHSFGRAKLRSLLQTHRPDAVFHTFPLLAMPEIRKQLGLQVPTYTVVTDFDLHGRWVHPDIDRYYVPTEDMRAELIARRIPYPRICVSGIPLRRGFGSVTVSPPLRSKYGIPAGSQAVLVMAGAQGQMSDVIGLCEALLACPGPLVAVVCGRNAKLAASLRETFAAPPAAERLRVFGYVEHMHELMALSACMVTKPGGLTLAEGLASGLPLFTPSPVPGQELRNARYLARCGAAVLTNDTEELAGEILKLLGDPLRLKNMQQALARLGRRYAADTIALDFLSSLNIMEEARPAAASVTTHADDAALGGF